MFQINFLRLRIKSEVRDSWTSRFWTLPELPICDAGQKDHSSGDENDNRPEMGKDVTKISKGLNLLKTEWVQQS